MLLIRYDVWHYNNRLTDLLLLLPNNNINCTFIKTFSRFSEKFQVSWNWVPSNVIFRCLLWKSWWHSCSPSPHMLIKLLCFNKMHCRTLCKSSIAVKGGGNKNGMKLCYKYNRKLWSNFSIHFYFTLKCFPSNTLCSVCIFT